MSPGTASRRAPRIARRARAARATSVPSDAVTRCEATRVVPAAVKTDILFVIDDSGSMDEEQANLRDNLAAFIDALVAAPIANEFQIGVTTTSVEELRGDRDDRAGLHARRSRPLQAVPGRRARRDPARRAPGVGRTRGTSSGTTRRVRQGPRILSATSPTLVEDFEANVRVGTDGTGKEQPFRAARLALSDRIADGTNAGFLRPGARLAIVVRLRRGRLLRHRASRSPAATRSVTTSQFKDASLDPMDDFVDFLRGPIDGELRDVGGRVDRRHGRGDRRAVLPRRCANTGVRARRFDGADQVRARSRRRSGPLAPGSAPSATPASGASSRTSPACSSRSRCRSTARPPTGACSPSGRSRRRGDHPLHRRARRVRRRRPRPASSTRRPAQGARRRSPSRTPAGSSRATGSQRPGDLRGLSSASAAPDVTTP